MGEIKDDEIELTGTQAISVKSLGWKRKEMLGLPSDTSLLAGFYDNWTSRYGKRFPWEDAWAWFGILRTGGEK